MRYPYHDASNDQFEDLVREICVFLLGDGVQGFSSGPDGGRDAKFHGTAARIPSESAPLNGRFVIQAKHTEHPYAKFSDPSFSGESGSATLRQEIPRIRKLVQLGECDHYLLFANRRLGGETEREIRNLIAKETGAKTVELFDVKRIDDIVKRYPVTMDRAGLSELKMPLRVTSEDLAEVILALDRQKATFKEEREGTEIHRTSFEEKNRINRLGEDFANEIKRTYVREFDIVRQFLGHPDNEEVKGRYLEAVAEFNEQVMAHRDNDQPLEEVLVNIQSLLWQRDGDLARRKRLTKLVLYYMYWVCDLGEDAAEC